MQKNLLIEEQSKGRHQNMKTYKILIIEDEEAIADLEKDYLELSGFDVEIATRGDVYCCFSKGLFKG